MKKIIIKDTLMKSVTLIVGFGLFAYVGRLLLQGKQVTEDISTNMIVLVSCGLLAVFLLALIFRPRLVTTNRRTLSGLGVFVILASHYMLIDNVGRMVYLRDVMILIGVYVAIAGAANLLIPQKIQEALAEENIEIIEI